MQGALQYCLVVWSLSRSFEFTPYTWAPSSEFVSSSIPSWQILIAHAQPFRGARDLAFCLKVPLDSLLVWASSEGSGETARMRRLAWTFAARISDKYQIRLSRSTLSLCLCGLFVLCLVPFVSSSCCHDLWYDLCNCDVFDPFVFEFDKVHDFIIYMQLLNQGTIGPVLLTWVLRIF